MAAYHRTQRSAIPRLSTAASSPALRLLGMLQEPLSSATSADGDSFELFESDVVWSSVAASPELDAQDVEPDVDRSSKHGSPSPRVANRILAPDKPSPSPHNRRVSPVITPSKLGLSGILDDASKPKAVQASAENIPYTVRRAPEAVPFRQSAPVSVPVWSSKKRPDLTVFDSDSNGIREEEDEDDGFSELVPPHVMVAQSRPAAFSVLEGAGRTLKGRDLCSVRNAVMRRTGFLD